MNRDPLFTLDANWRVVPLPRLLTEAERRAAHRRDMARAWRGVALAVLVAGGVVLAACCAGGGL